MDDPDWAIVNYSLVEKIAHSFHMSELWARARSHYDILTLNPLSDEVCECLTSSESDVIPALELLALKIKFPGLTSGQQGTPPAAPPAAAADKAKAYKLYIETGKKEASVVGPRRVARSADQVAPGYDIYAAHGGSGSKPKADEHAYRIAYDFSAGAQKQRRHLRNFDFTGNDEDVIR
eukprot:sb/3471839/